MIDHPQTTIWESMCSVLFPSTFSKSEPKRILTEQHIRTKFKDQTLPLGSGESLMCILSEPHPSSCTAVFTLPKLHSHLTLLQIPCFRAVAQPTHLLKLTTPLQVFKAVVKKRPLRRKMLGVEGFGAEAVWCRECLVKHV